MPFNFNGIPGAEVTITEDIKIDYSRLQTKIIRAGSSYYEVVPTGKKWLLLSAISQGTLFIRHPTDNLNIDVAKTDAGDYLQWNGNLLLPASTTVGGSSEPSMITYIEFGDEEFE